MLPRYFYAAKAENLYSIGLIRPTLTINFIVLKFACISCYLLVCNRSIKSTIDSIRCNSTNLTLVRVVASTLASIYWCFNDIFNYTCFIFIWTQWLFRTSLLRSVPFLIIYIPFFMIVYYLKFTFFHGLQYFL